MDVDKNKIWEALCDVMTLLGIRPENIPRGKDRTLLLDFIDEEYGKFSPEEIRLAFKLALSETFPAETNCFGDFNGRFVAGVLNAYRRWQEKNKLEAMKLQSIQQAIPAEGPKEDLSDGAMQDWWCQLKQQVEENKNYDVLFIPPMIYDWLDKKNMIRTTDKTKWTYFRRAIAKQKIILFQKAEEHATEENTSRLKKFSDKQDIGKIPGDEVENVKILAKKIMLLDLIQSRQMWNIVFLKNENAGRRWRQGCPFLPPSSLNKALFMYDWYISPEGVVIDEIWPERRKSENG